MSSTYPVADACILLTPLDGTPNYVLSLVSMSREPLSLPMPMLRLGVSGLVWLLLDPAERTLLPE